MAARRAQRGRRHGLRTHTVRIVVLALLATACGSSGDGASGTDPALSDPPADPAVTTDGSPTDPPPTDPPPTDPPPTDAPTTDAPAPESPTTDAAPITDPPPTTAPPTDPLDFDDAMLADVIAEVAADPLTGLPGRNTLATALLGSELAAGGMDLTGIGFAVYPPAATSGFVVMETDDSTPLVNTDDDAAAEAFVATLVRSPVLDDFAIERLVLRHAGSDGDGPFVITFVVPLDDLRAALDTGADAFENIVVQVERS